MNEKKGPGGSGGSGRIAVDVRKFSHSMTTVFYGLAELFSSMGAVEEGETLAGSDLVSDAERSVAKEREVQERRAEARKAEAEARKSATGKKAAGEKSKKEDSNNADGKDEGKSPGTGVPGRTGGDGPGDDGGTAGNDGAVGAEESGNGRQGSEVPMDRPGEPTAAGLDADHGGDPGGGTVPVSGPSEVNTAIASTSDAPTVDAGADETVDNGSSDEGDTGDTGGAGDTSITPDDITKVIVAKIKADRKNSAKIKKMLKEKYKADKVSQLKPEHYEAFLTDISGV